MARDFGASASPRKSCVKRPSKHSPARLRAAHEPLRAAIGRLASELVEKKSRPRVVLRCCHFPLYELLNRVSY